MSTLTQCDLHEGRVEERVGLVALVVARVRQQAPQLVFVQHTLFPCEAVEPGPATIRIEAVSYTMVVDCLGSS